MSDQKTNRREFIRLAATGVAALGIGVKGFSEKIYGNNLTPPLLEGQ